PRPVEQLDRMLDLAVFHPGPRFARQVADLQLRDAGREHRGLAAFVFADRLVVLVVLGERVRAREQRVDTTPLVGGDAALEEAGVNAELRRQPLDRLARGPGLAALDLADVLLREALSGELGLRQSCRHAKLPHALAKAVA